MSRAISPLSLLGLLLIVAGLVLTAVNPASRKIDNGQSLLDGKWASTFSADFDKNLAIRDTSIKLWATVNYILFDEARKGALVGADEWLYTEEEFDASDPAAGVARTIAFAREANRRFAAKGVKLVVALVPSKARMYPEHLGRYHWPRKLAPVYGELASALKNAGIAVVDIEAAMRADQSGQPLFLRTDTHWTPAGAGVAAAAIARHLNGLEPAVFPGGMNWRLKIAAPAAHQGDLLTYIPIGTLRNRLGPSDDRIQTLEAVASAQDEQEAGGLFDDADTPLLLVGTSYSANSKWGFEAQIKHAARVDLVNAAAEGQGPFKPVAALTHGTTLADSGARVIVWELPERYVWMLGDLGPPKRFEGTN